MNNLQDPLTENQMGADEPAGSLTPDYWPIRQLIVCLLQSAYRDLSSKNELHRTSAELWIAEEDYTYPLSFCNCCEYLHVDPDVARQALLGDNECITP